MESDGGALIHIINKMREYGEEVERSIFMNENKVELSLLSMIDDYLLYVYDPIDRSYLRRFITRLNKGYTKHTREHRFNPRAEVMVDFGVLNKTRVNREINYGINDIMEHNEIKTPDSYEFMVDMITKQFLGENGDKDLNDQIQNMADEDINNATTNLNNLLTDKVKDGNKSAEILTDMIGKLKHKLGDLKNTKNDGNGLQNILNIAKEITSEMTSNVDKDMIDPEDLWNTTSQLASQTVDSPAIDAIGLMVRNQIAKAKNNTKVSKEELNEDVMNVMSKLNIN